MNKRCAYLTLQDPNGFFIYDHATFAPLAARGWTVEEIPWTRPNVDWRDFSVVVIRSTWDYQLQHDRFLQTLSQIESQTQLLNPLAICRWNMRKTYLRELAAQGIPTVPTIWLDQLQPAGIAESFEKFATTHLVVKPIVGANADDTYPLEKDVASDNLQNALRVFAAKPVIVQPFIDSISAVGEHSLFYFAGRYSHAILKTPCVGDFRVQEEHGGRIQSVTAAADLLAVGEQVIQALGEKLLYARVDLVRLADAEPALMEVELIEPSLYFSYDAKSAERFADALEEMAQSS
jgi:hypothetical protein